MKTHMKRYTRAAIILLAGMLCVFAVYRLSDFIPSTSLVEAVRQFERGIEETVVNDTEGRPVILENSVSVKVIPRASGKSELYLLDGQGESIGFTVLKISGLLTVYNEADGSFSGSFATSTP